MTIESTALVNDTLVALTALPETMAWRTNSGQAFWPSGQPVTVNVKGCGDISGVRKGRAFSVECKYRSGKPGPSQRKFRDAWQAAGGVYIVAKSVDQASSDLVAAIP